MRRRGTAASAAVTSRVNVMRPTVDQLLCTQHHIQHTNCIYMQRRTPMHRGSASYVQYVWGTADGRCTKTASMNQTYCTKNTTRCIHALQAMWKPSGRGNYSTCKSALCKAVSGMLAYSRCFLNCITRKHKHTKHAHKNTVNSESDCLVAH